VGRILAIDYGKKRVGLAVSDPCGIIATGLQTVLSQEIFRFLEAYLSHEKVDLFVVGHPKQMDNSDLYQAFPEWFETQIPAYPHSHV